MRQLRSSLCQSVQEWAGLLTARRWAALLRAATRAAGAICHPMLRLLALSDRQALNSRQHVTGAACFGACGRACWGMFAWHTFQSDRLLRFPGIARGDTFIALSTSHDCSANFVRPNADLLCKLASKLCQGALSLTRQHEIKNCCWHSRSAALATKQWQRELYVASDGALNRLDTRAMEPPNVMSA